ncbi:hypothetical protein ACIRVK_25450 [Streptomyces sp. NPDC101152]|uniref:hypothetical protein n=1 Tax=Streptomyces sp. NPDC101152 TaxID=3366116 RepID=UPI0037FBFE65
MSGRNRRIAAGTAMLIAATVGLAGCGTKDARPTVVAPVALWPTSPPQVVQQRAYGCGTTVAPPARPSAPGDQVRLSVTGTRVPGDRVTAGYEISSPHAGTVLTYPVSPTPPTILLTRAGRVVGRQTPPASGTVDGRPAEGRPIGRHPFVSSLSVDRLCPGTTWPQVRSHPSLYRVEIVMSRQPISNPLTSTPAPYLADPLTTATARLTP